jgi:hypothetical protein
MKLQGVAEKRQSSRQFRCWFQDSSRREIRKCFAGCLITPRRTKHS